MDNASKSDAERGKRPLSPAGNGEHNDQPPEKEELANVNQLHVQETDSGSRESAELKGGDRGPEAREDGEGIGPDGREAEPVEANKQAPQKEESTGSSPSPVGSEEERENKTNNEPSKSPLPSPSLPSTSRRKTDRNDSDYSQKRLTRGKRPSPLSSPSSASISPPMSSQEEPPNARRSRRGTERNERKKEAEDTGQRDRVPRGKRGKSIKRQTFEDEKLVRLLAEEDGGRRQTRSSARGPSFESEAEFLIFSTRDPCRGRQRERKRTKCPATLSAASSCSDSASASQGMSLALKERNEVVGNAGPGAGGQIKSEGTKEEREEESLHTPAISSALFYSSFLSSLLVLKDDESESLRRMVTDLLAVTGDDGLKAKLERALEPPLLTSASCELAQLYLYYVLSHEEEEAANDGEGGQTKRKSLSLSREQREKWESFQLSHSFPEDLYEVAEALTVMTLRRLIHSKRIKYGVRSLQMKIEGEQRFADLLEDGTISYGEEVFQSPSGFACFLKGRSPPSKKEEVNNHYWDIVMYKGFPLSRFLRGQKLWMRQEEDTAKTGVSETLEQGYMHEQVVGREEQQPRGRETLEEASIGVEDNALAVEVTKEENEARVEEKDEVSLPDATQPEEREDPETANIPQNGTSVPSAASDEKGGEIEDQKIEGRPSQKIGELQKRDEKSMDEEELETEEKCLVITGGGIADKEALEDGDEKKKEQDHWPIVEEAESMNVEQQSTDEKSMSMKELVRTEESMEEKAEETKEEESKVMGEEGESEDQVNQVLAAEGEEEMRKGDSGASQTVLRRSARRVTSVPFYYPPSTSPSEDEVGSDPGESVFLGELLAEQEVIRAKAALSSSSPSPMPLLHLSKPTKAGRSRRGEPKEGSRRRKASQSASRRSSKDMEEQDMSFQDVGASEEKKDTGKEDGREVQEEEESEEKKAQEEKVETEEAFHKLEREEKAMVFHSEPALPAVPVDDTDRYPFTEEMEKTGEQEEAAGHTEEAMLPTVEGEQEDKEDKLERDRAGTEQEENPEEAPATKISSQDTLKPDAPSLSSSAAFSSSSQKLSLSSNPNLQGPPVSLSSQGPSFKSSSPSLPSSAPSSIPLSALSSSARKKRLGSRPLRHQAPGLRLAPFSPPFASPSLLPPPQGETKKEDHSVNHRPKDGEEKGATNKENGQQTSVDENEGKVVTNGSVSVLRMADEEKKRGLPPPTSLPTAAAVNVNEDDEDRKTEQTTPESTEREEEQVVKAVEGKEEEKKVEENDQLEVLAPFVSPERQVKSSEDQVASVEQQEEEKEKGEAPVEDVKRVPLSLSSPDASSLGKEENEKDEEGDSPPPSMDSYPMLRRDKPELQIEETENGENGLPSSSPSPEVAASPETEQTPGELDRENHSEGETKGEVIANDASNKTDEGRHAGATEESSLPLTASSRTTRQSSRSARLRKRIEDFLSPPLPKRRREERPAPLDLATSSDRPETMKTEDRSDLTASSSTLRGAAEAVTAPAKRVRVQRQKLGGKRKKSRSKKGKAKLAPSNEEVNVEQIKPEVNVEQIKLIEEERKDPESYSAETLMPIDTDVSPLLPTPLKEREGEEEGKTRKRTRKPKVVHGASTATLASRKSPRALAKKKSLPSASVAAGPSASQAKNARQGSEDSTARERLNEPRKRATKRKIQETEPQAEPIDDEEDKPLSKMIKMHPFSSASCPRPSSPSSALSTKAKGSKAKGKRGRPRKKVTTHAEIEEIKVEEVPEKVAEPVLHSVSPSRPQRQRKKKLRGEVEEFAPSQSKKKPVQQPQSHKKKQGPVKMSSSEAKAVRRKGLLLKVVEEKGTTDTVDSLPVIVGETEQGRDKAKKKIKERLMLPPSANKVIAFSQPQSKPPTQEVSQSAETFLVPLSQGQSGLSGVIKEETQALEPVPGPAPSLSFQKSQSPTPQKLKEAKKPRGAKAQPKGKPSKKKPSVKKLGPKMTTEEKREREEEDIADHLTPSSSTRPASSVVPEEAKDKSGTLSPKILPTQSVPKTLSPRSHARAAISSLTSSDICAGSVLRDDLRLDYVWDHQHFTDGSEDENGFGDKGMEARTEYSANKLRTSSSRRESSTRTSAVKSSLSGGGLDPHTLISCDYYLHSKPRAPEDGFPSSPSSSRALSSSPSSSNNQPFSVYINPEAAFLCDLHAHLADIEIIGFLGGRYDLASRQVFVQAAFPCRSLSSDAHDGSTDVEMDPSSEIEVREIIDKRGMQVVGWYHSHPLFEPNPSVMDIQNQHSYQTLFRREEEEEESERSRNGRKGGIEPFLGLIVGTYDPKNASNKSLFRYFHVRQEKVVYPMLLRVKMRKHRRATQEAPTEADIGNGIGSSCMYPEVFRCLGYQTDFGDGASAVSNPNGKGASDDEDAYEPEQGREDKDEMEGKEISLSKLSNCEAAASVSISQYHSSARREQSTLTSQGEEGAPSFVTVSQSDDGTTTHHSSSFIPSIPLCVLSESGTDPVQPKEYPFESQNLSQSQSEEASLKQGPDTRAGETKVKREVAGHGILGKRKHDAVDRSPSPPSHLYPSPYPRASAVPSHLPAEIDQKLVRISMRVDGKGFEPSLEARKRRQQAKIRELSARRFSALHPSPALSQCRESLRKKLIAYGRETEALVLQSLHVIDCYKTFYRRIVLEEVWKGRTTKLQKLEDSLRHWVSYLPIHRNQQETFLQDIIAYVRFSWEEIAY